MLNNISNMFFATISLFPVFTVISMDPPTHYPQLQIGLTKPNQKSVAAHLEIIHDTTTYVSQKVLETELLSHLKPYNLTPQDPFFCVKVSYIDKKGNPDLSEISPIDSVILPARIFYNCDDNSLINLAYKKKEGTDNILYKVQAICSRGFSKTRTIVSSAEDCVFDNNGMVIDAVANVIPAPKRKSFATQYANEMKKFYKNGANITFKLIPAQTEDLLRSEIIKQEENLALHMFLTPVGLALVNLPSFTHGKNGCPSEKTFEQLMITEKTKVSNNNVFNFVMNRQQYGSNSSVLMQQADFRNSKKQQEAKAYAEAIERKNVEEENKKLEEKKAENLKRFEENRNHKRGDCVLL